MLSQHQVSALATTVGSSRLAKQVARLLAAYKLPRQTVDVYRLKLRLNKGGIQTSAFELDELFRTFERLGLGKFDVFPTKEAHSTFTLTHEFKDFSGVLSAVTG